MKILLTGGGTGGHVYPLEAVAQTLKQLPMPAGETLELYFAGSTDYPLKSLQSLGVKIFKISSGKIRRYFSILNFLSPFIMGLGLLKALWVLWRIMPDVVFAKGGHGSLPVGLAAWFYRIPLLIHESDAVPGAANKFLALLATRVALGFPSAAGALSKKKSALVGNPIRAALAKPTPPFFNFAQKKPLLLIMGGSQGSTRLNAVVAESLGRALNDYNIIHQCGTSNFKKFSEELFKIFNVKIENHNAYLLKPFLDETELAAALQAADLIISRAGASSIFEIASSQKPAILIPLKEAAQNHQSRNAFDYARAGAAVVIEENNLTPQLLLNEVAHIINDPNQRNLMGQAAKQFYRPDASSVIANELLGLVKAQVPGLN